MKLKVLSLHLGIALLMVLGSFPVAAAQALATWDFTRGETLGWTGNPRVDPLRATAEGLIVHCTGLDPWIEGPAFAAPEAGLLRVTVEMSTDADTAAQWFYGPGFTAARSQSFPVVNDGTMRTYTVIIPESTGAGTRLRLDPCQEQGKITVRRIVVEGIEKPASPAWPPPKSIGKLESPYQIVSGSLRLAHDRAAWNRVQLRWQDQLLAAGYEGELLGVFTDSGVEYLRLQDGELQGRTDDGFGVTVTMPDRQGTRWTVQRRFHPGGRPGAIEVQTSISVDHDARVVLLPWWTLLAGHGSYGSRKHQALFAGLEYLEDEPSSSEADLTGPAHVRRVPDSIKSTFPLMAIEHAGYYLGLAWEPSPWAAAGFDSPDRVFGSSGHAMWLSGPSVGPLRFENDLVAHSPMTLKAGQKVGTRMTVLGGRSDSVMGAVQDYLAHHPLPPLPEFQGGYEEAVNLLAHGWLDSAINDGWRFKHAEWMGNFKPQPAADAALLMRWLGRETMDAALGGRLREGARLALEVLPANDPYASGVSHVRLPTAPLVFGRIPAYVVRRRSEAWAALGQFDEEGRVLYRPGKVDYGRTHFANHANGLGSGTLAQALEAAVLCGDKALGGKLVDLLDRQTALYRNGVPRGAQTWEIPLHTPDILASAHMVRAYVYGYALTGREELLAQAKYWAWTGVPFVYLHPPTGGACGAYATIAVLGATSWVAPVWIGQPVQWCGLVYGSSLHLLSQFDPAGPWKTLARGITRAGLQMTWPITDQKRQGLLPDFFHLARQVSDGPAINPGTVGAHLPEAFERGTLYQFHRLATGGFLHAPCAVTETMDDRGQKVWGLAGWGGEPYHVLLSGVNAEQLGIKTEPPAREVSRLPDQGWIVVTLAGPGQLWITD